METILATMADQLGQMLVILGAALAVGFAGSGSAWGIGLANEAAAGIMTEDPKKFGYALVLLALPGTQGIYGLLVAVLAMQKSGRSAPAARPSPYGRGSASASRAFRSRYRASIPPYGRASPPRLRSS